MQHLRLCRDHAAASSALVRPPPPPRQQWRGDLGVLQQHLALPIHTYCGLPFGRDCQGDIERLTPVPMRQLSRTIIGPYLWRRTTYLLRLLYGEEGHPVGSTTMSSPSALPPPPLPPCPLPPASNRIPPPVHPT